MTWRWIEASVTGQSHIESNEKGQDYCRTRVIQISDKEFFISLVSDGAGSTVNGGLGAKIICDAMMDNIISSVRNENIANVSEEEIKSWVASARDLLDTTAKQIELPIREYACTLLGAVISDRNSLFFQIGDGGIVTQFDTLYEPLFWPEQGEYANTTFFVSDEEFLKHLMVKKFNSAPKEIALFTDGLQNLVLSYSEKTAHSGFFIPLFDFIRKNPHNEFIDLSGQLRFFLNRPEINARSDDDKTLVLATRLTV
jgi:hypothetical protein